MEHVVIVGAGVIGAACALSLLEAGVRVTLMDRSVPGGEASGAAAGILGAQAEVADAGPLLELGLASRALFPELIRHLQGLTGIDVGYQTEGVLEVALDPQEGRMVAGRAEWMLQRHLRVEILDRESALRLEPALTNRMIGANYYPDDHSLDPNRFCRALVTAVARQGGTIRNGTRVAALLTDKEEVIGVVTEAREKIRADAVVITAGAWSTRIPGMPTLRTMVKPMAGQIVQAETWPRLLHRVIYGLKGYLVPRADGRVLMGSTLEDRSFDKAVTVAGIQKITNMALELVPDLNEARQVTTWCGLRPATADNRPMLGAGPLRRLFLATGHYRNGILLAPITATILRDLILGREASPLLQEFATCGSLAYNHLTA